MLRRFIYYSSGLLLGAAMVYFLFGKRFPSWLPGDVIRAKMQSKTLVYTRHALCRMECRYIDTSDVRQILNKGRINFGKSRVRRKPCPTYALEGTTGKGESLRIVFAACKDKTRVVTAIALNEDYPCRCLD